MFPCDPTAEKQVQKMDGMDGCPVYIYICLYAPNELII